MLFIQLLSISLPLISALAVSSSPLPQPVSEAGEAVEKVSLATSSADAVNPVFERDQLPTHIKANTQLGWSLRRIFAVRPGQDAAQFRLQEGEPSNTTTSLRSSLHRNFEVSSSSSSPSTLWATSSSKLLSLVRRVTCYAGLRVGSCPDTSTHGGVHWYGFGFSDMIRSGGLGPGHLKTKAEPTYLHVNGWSDTGRRIAVVLGAAKQSNTTPETETLETRKNLEAAGLFPRSAIVPRAGINQYGSGFRGSIRPGALGPGRLKTHVIPKQLKYDLKKFTRGRVDDRIKSVGWPYRSTNPNPKPRWLRWLSFAADADRSGNTTETETATETVTATKKNPEAAAGMFPRAPRLPGRPRPGGKVPPMKLNVPALTRGSRWQTNSVGWPYRSPHTPPRWRRWFAADRRSHEADRSAQIIPTETAETDSETETELKKRDNEQAAGGVSPRGLPRPGGKVAPIKLDVPKLTKGSSWRTNSVGWPYRDPHPHPRSLDAAADAESSSRLDSREEGNDGGGGGLEPRADAQPGASDRSPGAVDSFIIPRVNAQTGASDRSPGAVDSFIIPRAQRVQDQKAVKQSRGGKSVNPKAGKQDTPRPPHRRRWWFSSSTTTSPESSLASREEGIDGSLEARAPSGPKSKGMGSKPERGASGPPNKGGSGPPNKQPNKPKPPPRRWLEARAGGSRINPPDKGKGRGSKPAHPRPARPPRRRWWLEARGGGQPGIEAHTGNGRPQDHRPPQGHPNRPPRRRWLEARGGDSRINPPAKGGGRGSKPDPPGPSHHHPPPRRWLEARAGGRPANGDDSGKSQHTPSQHTPKTTHPNRPPRSRRWLEARGGGANDPLSQPGNGGAQANQAHPKPDQPPPRRRWLEARVGRGPPANGDDGGTHRQTRPNLPSHPNRPPHKRWLEARVGRGRPANGDDSGKGLPFRPNRPPRRRWLEARGGGRPGSEADTGNGRPQDHRPPLGHPNRPPRRRWLEARGGGSRINPPAKGDDSGTHPNRPPHRRWLEARGGGANNSPDHYANDGGHANPSRPNPDPPPPRRRSVEEAAREPAPALLDDRSPQPGPEAPLLHRLAKRVDALLHAAHVATWERAKAGREALYAMQQARILHHDADLNAAIASKAVRLHAPPSDIKNAMHGWHVVEAMANDKYAAAMKLKEAYQRAQAVEKYDFQLVAAAEQKKMAAEKAAAKAAAAERAEKVAAGTSLKSGGARPHH